MWDTSSSSHFAPLLPESNYQYGNVRKSLVTDDCGCIDGELAESIPVGRRGQRKGLLYDQAYPDFDPVLWPHVVPAPGSGEGLYRVELEGGGVLLVVHERGVDSHLVGIGECWLDQHFSCCDGDGAHGSMVGVGQHLRRDGRMGDYVLSGGEGGRPQIKADMERAEREFGRVFRGRGVGFEQMLERQGELWRQSGRPGAWHYLFFGFGAV